MASSRSLNRGRPSIRVGPLAGPEGVGQGGHALFQGPAVEVGHIRRQAEAHALGQPVGAQEEGAALVQEQVEATPPGRKPSRCWRKTTDKPQRKGKGREPEGSLPFQFGGNDGFYSATVWQKRMRIVAIWARVAVPWGRRVSSSKPWRRPSATAQERAWAA